VRFGALLRRARSQKEVQKNIQLTYQASLSTALFERRSTMRITFTARHFKPSERLKEHAHLQAEKLKKFSDGILDIEIILDYIKQVQKAELVAKVYGTRLTVVEESEDMYKSIDLAMEKMERQLAKHKDKLREFTNDRIAENVENIES